MKSGKCPKCGSEEIHFNKYGEYGVPIILGISTLFQKGTSVYIWGNCCYIELYLEGNDLDKVKKKWSIVS